MFSLGGRSDFRSYPHFCSNVPRHLSASSGFMSGLRRTDPGGGSIALRPAVDRKFSTPLVPFLAPSTSLVMTLTNPLRGDSYLSEEGRRT